MKRRELCRLFFVLSALLVTAPARAYFTPILPSINEPDLLGPNQDDGSEGILDYLYGLDNLVRIEDDWDQVWNEFDGGAIAEVRFFEADFAGLTYDFGYLTGASTRHHLFSASGGGYDAMGSGEFTSDTPFRWYLSPLPTVTWSSQESENGPSYNDHMTTWLITGGPNAGRAVLAWETLDPGDQDFNDLVVEVYGVSPIPEPSAVFLMGGGLLGLGFWTARRRRHI